MTSVRHGGWWCKRARFYVDRLGEIRMGNNLGLDDSVFASRKKLRPGTSNYQEPLQVYEQRESEPGEALDRSADGGYGGTRSGLAGEILPCGGSLESCFSYLDVVPLETGLGASRETARKKWIHAVLLRDRDGSAQR